MTATANPLFGNRSLPEGTVTFLFSDIVDSTPLWENQPALMQKALEIHNQALSSAIQANQGVIFKIVGDAFQASFTTAPQAVQAAVEGQRRLQSASWNELGPLKVRMGIHTGEAYKDQIGDEYAVSHTKNRVARIMSAGHGGQILLSEESANLCRPILNEELRLVDLGEQHLKGLTKPECIFQVIAPGLEERFPPLAVPPRPIFNLPAKLTRFFGRENESAQLQALLAQHRLVTIIGPGGVGKTRLALHVAHQRTGNFKDGVCFVALDPINSTDELIPTIASSLQFPLRGKEDATTQLANYLHAREMLLVLDNFEHILDGSSLLVSLLEGTEELRLLVTSREALNIMEELRFPLKGLAYQNASNDPAFNLKPPTDEAAYQDAVQLFIDRARQARRDFSPEGVYQHILKICQLVEGYPLALELAAAWVRSLTCSEIVAEIEANISILSATLRNLPERHRSLQAIFDQSWGQLDEAERDVFMRLSVFRGGFRRDAAERVAGASLLILSRLVDKSLLRWEAERYQIHRLLRHYAEEKLAADPKATAQTIDRHCNYFAHFLFERYTIILNQQNLEKLKQIDAEIDNIRLAWEWALDSHRMPELRIILRSVYFYYQVRSRYLEWWKTLIPIAQALEKMPPETEAEIVLAEVMISQTWMAIRLGKFDQAEEKAARSLEIFEKTATSPPTGMGMDPKVALAILLHIRGEYQKAMTLSEEGLAACRKRGDMENLPFFYYTLASATSALGDYQSAGEHAQTAIDLCREQNNDWFMAYCLIEKGVIERAQDRYEAAKWHFYDSYIIRDVFQDPEGRALALNHLGQIALLEEDYSAALDLFQRSLALYQDLSDQGGLATSLAGLGEAQLGLQNLTDACQSLIRALHIAVEIEFVPLVFATLTGAGHLLVRIDQLEGGLSALKLVISHPASSREVKKRAERYLWRAQAQVSVESMQTIINCSSDEVWQEARKVLDTLEKTRAARFSGQVAH
jgi:predicted ATPase/class 3 adenylate cyclase